MGNSITVEVSSQGSVTVRVLRQTTVVLVVLVVKNFVFVLHFVQRSLANDDISWQGRRNDKCFCVGFARLCNSHNGTNVG